MLKLTECFKVLELHGTESIAEVKTRWRTLVKKYHPDQKTGDKEAFQLIEEAYGTLRNHWKTSTDEEMCADNSEPSSEIVKDEETIVEELLDKLSSVSHSIPCSIFVPRSQWGNVTNTPEITLSLPHGKVIITSKDNYSNPDAIHLTMGSDCSQISISPTTKKRLMGIIPKIIRNDVELLFDAELHYSSHNLECIDLIQEATGISKQTFFAIYGVRLGGSPEAMLNMRRIMQEVVRQYSEQVDKHLKYDPERWCDEEAGYYTIGFHMSDEKIKIDKEQPKMYLPLKGGNCIIYLLSEEWKHFVDRERDRIGKIVRGKKGKKEALRQDSLKKATKFLEELF